MAIKITGVNIIDDGFNILNLAKISAGASFGTAGQVLTSGGPSANVSWAAVSTGTGRLLREPQVLTSGTSYTTPAGCTGIYVEAVGGGGGGRYGGGIGAGGGAGGYCARYFTVTASTAYTYAIGAGGTGGTSVAVPTSGGNTTFTVGATTIRAEGGRRAETDEEPGVGGYSANGTINVKGGGGGSYIITSGWNFSGYGGSSFFGGGGTIRRYSGTGESGQAGGGGSGGVLGNNGGAGGAGLIRIMEFA